MPILPGTVPRQMPCEESPSAQVQAEQSTAFGAPSELVQLANISYSADFVVTNDLVAGEDFTGSVTLDLVLDGVSTLYDINGEGADDNSWAFLEPNDCSMAQLLEIPVRFTVDFGVGDTSGEGFLYATGNDLDHLWLLLFRFGPVAWPPSLVNWRDPMPALVAQRCSDPNPDVHVSARGLYNQPSYSLSNQLLSLNPVYCTSPAEHSGFFDVVRQ